ncbi:MAG: MaoC family dehydratase N-terminal domain-containing protein [Deltaproteobacteria bacterium]|nr:MaoC family dehydratase N-terminal domain-containing protein [Deltaproteobacteria bacterium]
MKLNRNLIGKQYPPQDYGVTAEATMRYALAYNDDNPWFLDTGRPGGIIAPPMFGVVMGWMPIMLVMTDSELGADLLRLLHSEQEMFFYKPVVPGDIVTSTATILSMEEKATGETVVVEVVSATQDREPVQRMLFTAFIRGGGRRERKSEDISREERPEGEPLLRVAQTIDADQTYRYAQASGDYNPIHTDEAVAKMAGLPGIVVHGLCTLAFTSKVIIDQCCAGDPRRLKRLRARFLRPVLPGQTIATAVWARPDRDGVNVYAYETDNPEGKAVITDGRAEVAAA